MGRDYYLRSDCGHKEWDGINMSSEDRMQGTLKGQCWPCREARIGTEIAFVRYGAPPASGRSWDKRDNVALDGVSVYEVVNGKPVHVAYSFGIVDRSPVICGRAILVGWGSDGEPLVDWSTVTTDADDAEDDAETRRADDALDAAKDREIREGR